MPSEPLALVACERCGGEGVEHGERASWPCRVCRHDDWLEWGHQAQADYRQRRASHRALHPLRSAAIDASPEDASAGTAPLFPVAPEPPRLEGSLAEPEVPDA